MKYFSNPFELNGSEFAEHFCTSAHFIGLDRELIMGGLQKARRFPDFKHQYFHPASIFLRIRVSIWTNFFYILLFNVEYFFLFYCFRILIWNIEYKNIFKHPFFLLARFHDAENKKKMILAHFFNYPNRLAKTLSSKSEMKSLIFRIRYEIIYG